MVSKDGLLHAMPFIRCFDLGDNILHAEWCGYINVSQVKTGCEIILSLIKKHGYKLVINDNQLVLGSWTQAINWLKDDFMPRVVEEGVKKIAFLYSPQASARYSVNRLLEINDGYEGQTFENIKEALQWISGQENYNFQRAYLHICVQRGMSIKLDLKDILYISSNGKQINIHGIDEVYSMRSSLKAILQKLPTQDFQRIHKSYIVNLKKAGQLKYHAGGAYKLYLKDMGNIYIPVGREYAQELKKMRNPNLPHSVYSQ
jgi:hypothetical protein